jgi:hypothetical protein
VVSGHHRAVLNEISFLRQISLQAPVPVPDQVQGEKVGLSRKKTVAIDNIALLGNIMGGKTGEYLSVISYSSILSNAFGSQETLGPGKPRHGTGFCSR